MDEQLFNLQQWVAQRLPQVFGGEPLSHEALLARWQPVAGDASLRRYYRVAYPVDDTERTVIVMDSAAALDAAHEFVRVASLLRIAQPGSHKVKAGQSPVKGEQTLVCDSVRVPAIYSADLDQGYVLLEDFGDDRLKNYLDENAGDALFKKILPVLCSLARCPAGELPAFNEEKLQSELDLFDDWFLQRHRNLMMSPAEREAWQQLCRQLINGATAQPQVVVHRDFHSCNLHQLPDGSIGVIDFQDAVVGPVTYDLASWLWDRYIHWPRESLEHWMAQARAPLCEVAGVMIDRSTWQRDIDWMGLQRNLKIVGIFARLHYRDNKAGYLAMIPQFAAYINDVLPRYPEFAAIQDTMRRWLSA